ncbi:hypothetical protein G5B10_00785 [Fluviicola sp. SGL-29]|nr:hypothetical protein [Fluviicola sp. SGL-29]
MIPIQLKEEVADLQKVGYQIQLHEVGNRIYIEFQNFALPIGYNANSTTLIVWTGNQYPRCAFDMFWVDSGLLLENGTIPHAAAHFESHLGKTWRRYSIHPYNFKPWNPCEDSLTGYLTYINQRLNHLA